MSGRSPSCLTTQPGFHHACVSAERPKLSHAGPVEVNRAAELNPLPGVGCSAWLNSIRFADRGVIGLLRFGS